MEVITRTEYQDIYQEGSLLLVVNKFKYLFEDNTVSVVDSKNISLYNKDTKDLTICKAPTKDYTGNKLNYGTVLYDNKPVVKTNNKNEWKYKIITDDNSCDYCKDDVIGLLQDLINVIDVLSK